MWNVKWTPAAGGSTGQLEGGAGHCIGQNTQGKPYHWEMKQSYGQVLELIFPPGIYGHFGGCFDVELIVFGMTLYLKIAHIPLKPWRLQNHYFCIDLEKAFLFSIIDISRSSQCTLMCAQDQFKSNIILLFLRPTAQAGEVYWWPWLREWHPEFQLTI